MTNLKSLNPVRVQEHFSTKEVLLSSEKIAIEKFEAIELKAILKIVNKTLGKLVSTDLNIRVETGSLIFNVVNQVEIKLNRQVDGKFNDLCFNINALMFEKNSTLVKSEIVKFDMVNRIILADKNIISAYYDNSNNTMIEYEKEKYERQHQLRKITDKERTQLGKQGIYITTETIYKSFDNKDLYDTSYNETMNTTSFEISTDNKEVLEALKELGVKKARKIKEIKTNDLYIVEFLEAPEVIEVKKEVSEVESDKELTVLETIESTVKKHGFIEISNVFLEDKSIFAVMYNSKLQSIDILSASNNDKYFIQDFTRINQRKILELINCTLKKVESFKACNDRMIAYKYEQEVKNKERKALKASIPNNIYHDDIEVIKVTVSMSKAQIFKLAHKLAKTFEGNYSACLSMALKEVYAKIKSLKETSLSLAA